jgi:alkanesulfonate monooxygenase SsuD/methylene tetrahydromethanopterin reductase-like flavin-dependent oxidoreductase (luciferase family)
MPDYGHELAFGTFITPQAERAADVVALARLTEHAGLELATFQDHPYQRRFLDTWTLLSWVAAETELLRVAPNVLNVPLRPPALVARAAASLDLLSAGRVELGLGAGAFWDGIAALGGRRLTGGQSVDALEEAIDVIRMLWAVDEPGGARFEGTYYRLAGAARGPATTSGSGSARTSRACSISSAARATAGCRASRTSSRATSRGRTRPSTPPRHVRDATRRRSGGS